MKATRKYSQPAVSHTRRVSGMFARKTKPSDYQSSLQRFCDVQRDPTSRVKHFRLLLEGLPVAERKQLIEDYAFETFHLVDALLLQAEVATDGSNVNDVEAALSTLEHLLCLAPELIGRGWQRHAIENVLKRALLPNNVVAVRKIAIRLFILWYESLAVFNNAGPDLDRVFQCLLPYFPLRDGANTERILQEYCLSPIGFVKGQPPSPKMEQVFGFNPVPIRRTPILPNPSSGTGTLGGGSLRERAQLLQIYLDKFLDYCHRETVKIEWSDSRKHYECAQFLLNRVIVLYIEQVFPDLEENGVDVFGGWEGIEEPGEQLDTADPVVIARYWLVRWMTNIASSSLVEEPAPGLSIFRQALFSSQKASNTLLTLMRESMQLPLACCNVIQKVLVLVRHWLLQKDCPSFVGRDVSVEAFSLLLIHVATSFFHSPYLTSSGDRLSSAVSITHSILQMTRELVNPGLHVLPVPLGKSVWAELVKRLTDAVQRCCSRSDAFGRATTGGFTHCLLSVCVFVCGVREVDLDDKIWDDVWQVFLTTAWWQPMIEQWSKIVDSVTRALILNLFAIDIHDDPTEAPPPTGPVRLQSVNGKSAAAVEDDNHHAQRSARQPKPRTSSDTGGGGLHSDDDANSSNGSGNGVAAAAAATTTSDAAGERDMLAVVQATGNATNWLRVWMRIVNLIDPTESAHAQLAVQTISRCIETLLSIACAHSLVHWLAGKLLALNSAQQPHAIPALCSVLIRAFPPPEQRAEILCQLIECLGTPEVGPIVLEQLPAMGVEDSAVLSAATIESLGRIMQNADLSSRAIKVAALLAMDHPEAEKMLLSILENRSIEFDIPSLILAVNALCLLILERADAQLFDTLLRIIIDHPTASSSLLAVLCSNLASSTRLGFQKRLVEAIEYGIKLPRDGRILNDSMWQLTTLAIAEKPHPSWRSLLQQIDCQKNTFLLGCLITLAMQFPLPGFSIAQWDSIDRPLTTMDEAEAKKFVKSTVFLRTPGTVISFHKPVPNKQPQPDDIITFTTRTVVGKHVWSLCSQPDTSAPSSHGSAWLKNLSLRSKAEFATARKIHRRPQPGSEVHQELLDPFKALPLFEAVMALTPAERALQAQESMDMLAFIRRSTRKAVSLTSKPPTEAAEISRPSAAPMRAWRKFTADAGLTHAVAKATPSFARELRHLDNTRSRETHKVAVIYVGENQHDKTSILANTQGSPHFDCFVEGLGWPVVIGGYHAGYTGGLPAGQVAPYYATSDTEVVFHVSTQLEGSAQMKMKHLGNDEVHVVWCESGKPYRRDIIATRFCDVLIVCYPVSPVLIRVHVETTNPALDLGPLFDGVCVHTKQVPSLVRDTVINASRAYRLAQPHCDRPNKHRERVFDSVTSCLGEMPVAESITHLFVPSMRS